MRASPSLPDVSKSPHSTQTAIQAVSQSILISEANITHDHEFKKKIDQIDQQFEIERTFLKSNFPGSNDKTQRIEEVSEDAAGTPSLGHVSKNDTMGDVGEHNESKSQSQSRFTGESR